MSIILQPDSDIFTARCTLEPLLPPHATLLFGGLKEPSLYTWLPGSPPASASTLEARYQRLENRKSPDKSQLWLNWAVRETESGHYVGTVEATVEPDARAHIAYFVFLPYQRQGFASEACKGMLSYLFSSYPLETVSLLCDTRNQASIALAERLGFTRKKRISDADYFKGQTSDEFLYQLSAPD